MNGNTVNDLREQVAATERLLDELKKQLSQAERKVEEANRLRDTDTVPKESIPTNGDVRRTGSEKDSLGAWQTFVLDPGSRRWPLLRDEYTRYGRQLIMPEVGLRGQLLLKKAKVLIVGVGGLGCPAAAYLAGAGVGGLGLMDGDTVELSNLHRQVAHATDRVGINKAESAYKYLRGLNHLVHYTCHSCHLTPEAAISIFQDYDLVLDCTDHSTSRYLISDACVLVGKPLVSASALRTDGQLIVLNNPARPPGDRSGGPCYRCIFPKPPPADSVISCGEGGVLGPVVGVMGVLQALEAIKVLCSSPLESMTTTNGAGEDPPKTSMLMFSAYTSPQFRTVRMRSRRSNCPVCSSAAYINEASLSSGSLDYVAFCGVTAPINVLSPHQRVSAKDFANLTDNERGSVIDVRDETQFAICALPHSVNVPWTGDEGTWHDRAVKSGVFKDDGSMHYIVCRFGNDSQLAAKAITDRSTPRVRAKDIRGGFQAWREDVDPEWPGY